MRVMLAMLSHTYRAGAFLDAARTLGVEVTVASERAQALAALHPAGHLTLDFSDPPRAAAAIADFGRRHPLDAVVATDDEGAWAAALAARELGLRHAAPGAVAAAGDKALMRAAFERAGLPGPRVERFTTADDPASFAGRMSYPCVVKPTRLAASRGVIRANDAREFVEAFRRTGAIVEAAAATITGPRAAGAAGATAPGAILVESFLPGVEVAVEGVLTAGVLRVLAMFDKPDPLDGPWFEETLYVTPSRHRAQVREAIVDAVDLAARALGLDHGPVHAEVRWDGSRAVVVEIAPRSIGGLCSRALRFDPDGSLESVLLRHALGDPIERVERESRASGVMMLPIPRAGTLAGVRGAEAARAVAGIDDVRITIPVGDRLVPLPEGARYLGFVFARAGTPEAVEAALRAAHGLLEFDIVSEAAPQAARIAKGHSA